MAAAWRAGGGTQGVQVPEVELFQAQTRLGPVWGCWCRGCQETISFGRVEHAEEGWVSGIEALGIAVGEAEAPEGGGEGG